MQEDHNAELIGLLGLAMIPDEGETAVVDFVVELFKALGYVRRQRLARTRVDFPFFICGEDRHAKTDVCIVDRSRNDILLVVQVDNRLQKSEPISARAQLVAKAVAAFNENNAQREAMGLPPMASKVMPGWHIARILQDSRHANPVGSYCSWVLSSSGNTSHLLPSTCPSSCSSA
ncbi:uncharacterized protein LACBIDRAFT_317009 [Laccaria bicolor S238N-H82]|uniref:Predicted protein n=1 Tax=Laccaria bicolor (strain S238N-H82 / ATCC MYA-4686) TaxID=486041 RepID=B0D466_LACBS|nr:uncharacterized protein LACBIDRAFT_317009 [Laccaria bicolor S238N-H82]EDR10521.1 predicted protein [Laccaria bicolor S238N-H82]|eukprot:XP_001878971.1 predicted protein [Laccaria bicolor S238N-H82]